MNKHFKHAILFGLILSIFISSSAFAQTSIRVIADQPEKLIVKMNDEPVTVTDSSVIFGDNIEISGGQGPFAYQWMKNGENTGTEPLLEVFSSISSEIYTLRVTDANRCAALIAMPGDIEIPSDVEDEPDRSRVSLYPIPASQNITIDPGDRQEILRVAFYNSSGDILLETQIQGKRTIMISLPAGIYMVRITGTRSRLTEVKRLVVL